MHGVDEAEAFLDAAFADEAFDGIRHVNVATAARDLEPEMFSQGFHSNILLTAPRVARKTRAGNQRNRGLLIPAFA